MKQEGAMTKRSWISTGTFLLVAATASTVGLDGCADDGVGTIPSALYQSATADNDSGDNADPGSTSTPTSITPPPIGDAQVDVYKPPPPPKDSGSPPPPVDSGSDTGTPDAGPQDAAADG
jgi:hypothetical protein